MHVCVGSESISFCICRNDFKSCQLHNEKRPLNFSETIPGFHCPESKKRKKNSENIVGKGENAGNQHFLLFPQCFLAYQRKIASFEPH